MTVPGTIQFSGNVGVDVSEKVVATLSLVGSSNVSSFPATLSLQNAYATISTTTCPLSSRYPTCSFTITGAAAGTDKISASASGYVGASMVATVDAPPQPGYLVFSTPSESMAVGDTARVQLSLGGSSGVTGLSVQVASTAKASVLPLTCSLNSNGPPCPIEITGVTAGAATITASAAQYTSATNSVTVTAQPVVTYGQLQFTQLSPQVNVGSQVAMVLELVGSANVDNLQVTLNNSTPSVASLSKTSCILSTLNSTCSFQVTGGSQGSDPLSTTTSSPGPSVQAQATVTVGTATPSLFFTPSQLVMGVGDQGSSPTTLAMSNLPPGVTYSVNLVPEYPLKPSPGLCSFLADSSEACSVNISQWDTPVGAGTYQFQVSAIPSASDQPTLSATLTVTVAPVTPVQRTITVVNNCNQTVYAAISGGASGIAPAPGTPPVCPAGTALASTGDCFWANPVPTSSTSVDGYTLTPGQSTRFVISQVAMQAEWNNNDSGWNGNVMGRLGCSTLGNCAIGSCNGGPPGVNLACVPGVSFSNPQTMAEFTLQTGQLDTYDITLISGATIPTSMKVTGVTADPANPFSNGEAGAVAAQAGSNYTLPGSSWTFDPTSSDTTVPAATYNLLSSTLPLGSPCPTGTGCGSQQVCGYTLSALQQGSPTYQLMCGQRLAYISAAAIWALNPNFDAAAPFPFTQAF
ncbi:MAG: thaumatin family protein, partial [Deltaproteobacteria bacterium]